MEDKYLTYSSIALAGEESFVRLVRHGENESTWKEWLANHPDRQSTFDEATRIVIAFDNASPAKISDADKKQLWNSISSNFRSAPYAKPHNNIKGLWRWAMAAAASLALLFWFGSEAGKSNVYAEAGEHKEIVLPEKSIVSLNAGSHILYKEKSFEKDRVLYLDGEAFFDVEPGSIFQVQTNEGTVTVVGTSFNVLVRNGRFEVSCFTGKVTVENKAKDKTALTSGQMTTLAANTTDLSKSNFNANAGKPEWTNGKFHFENRPLKEVISELERQYNVKVVLPKDLANINYTGLFESGDLAEALELITWPLHLKSSIKGKTITITR